MARLNHGHMMTTEDLRAAREGIAESLSQQALALPAEPLDLHDFDYLFPDLAASSDALLPESPTTVQALVALGSSMTDEDERGEAHDSDIPAAYTYFGQFVDHDISHEGGAITSTADLLQPDMAPQGLAEIRNGLRNVRTATLDLDSVYGVTAPRDPQNPSKMQLGRNSDTGSTSRPLAAVAGKALDNDLPREGRSADPTHDRAALTGDPRNDENTIISQMHVAFLKAHNALVDQGRPFQEAQRILRQHYQHIVVHDFLPRVCDPQIVDRVLHQGNQHFNAMAEPFFMPLEFSFAAYRFGHSMVRGGYDFNVNFNFADGQPATLDLLFTFSALMGDFDPAPGVDFDTLPANWIIQWENLVGDDDPAVGKARRLDTTLAKVGSQALFQLRTVQGQPEVGLAAFLAVRNLLRGYRVRLPSGQAVAERMGLPVLTPQQILDEASSPERKAAIEQGGFQHRTPLWYYVLAEAGHHGGKQLGPVGSTLVAEVMIGLVRRSAASILRTPGWAPSLPSRTPGTFTLADLLAFAGVLDQPTAPSRLYTVRPGDTLTKIARQELGDERRWPEIFVLNRAVIRNPDLIVPGQVLTLPGDTPMQPPPRLHVVKRGETLSKIAQKELGDRNRWPEIFALNGDVIANPDVIVIGQVLLLPPDLPAQPTRRQGARANR